MNNEKSSVDLYWVAVVSLVVGIVSRMTLTPVVGLESRAFAGFSAVMLLLAIALALLKKE